jgi:hypothetical protein
MCLHSNNLYSNLCQIFFSLIILTVYPSFFYSDRSNAQYLPNPLSLINKSQNNKSDNERDSKSRINKNKRSANTHSIVIEVRINSNPSNIAVGNDNDAHKSCKNDNNHDNNNTHTSGDNGNDIKSKSNNAIDSDENGVQINLNNIDNSNDDNGSNMNRGKLLGLILINTRLDKTALVNHEIRE